MTGVRNLVGVALAAVMVTVGAAWAQDASSSAAAATPVAVAGDATAGAGVFKKCAACHNIGPGAKNKIGPSLTGVVGRAPGTFPGFNYSAAMKDFGSKNPTWTPGLLASFLHGPGKLVPGTKMTFAGLPEQADIDNVIAYLASQTTP